MRVAFIGAGKMATVLMDHVDDYDGADITAVCDVDKEAATAAAEPYQATVVTDHEVLFADHEFDTVFVAIPPFAYSNQSALAIEHGVDLFVEKPVGLHPEYARGVSALLADSDIVTSSGYVFRYDRITERALHVLEDRTVSLIDGRYWNGLLASSWGNELSRSGGDVNIRATHVYDLVRYFGGNAARVFASGADRVGIDEIDYDDAIASVVEHENGVVSTITSSVTAPEWTVELSLVGDGFELHLDYTEQTLVGTVDGEEIEYDGECDRYFREIETFLDAASAGDQSRVRSSYPDATKTLELNWAVIDSATGGESIDL